MTPAEQHLQILDRLTFLFDAAEGTETVLPPAVALVSLQDEAEAVARDLGDPTSILLAAVARAWVCARRAVDEGRSGETYFELVNAYMTALGVTR